MDFFKKIMDFLYGNVGKKLMVWAQISGVLSIVGGLFAGLYFLCDSSYSYWYGTRTPNTGNDWLFFVCIIGGIIGVCGTWFLYGFGQLLDNVYAMRKNSDNAKKEPDSDELPEL